MMRSLYSGVSGLQNHQVRMDVIGNNISNVNTIGFKKGRVNFQDMISQSMGGAAKPTNELGGVNPKQVGLGMAIASIDTIHTQGSLQTTSKTDDLAIQGNGFFIMSSGAKQFYTRAGAFGLDQDGTLVNPANGMKVQGWSAESVDGQRFINTASDPGDISIPIGGKDPASATTEVEFACNLDKRLPELAEGAGAAETRGGTWSIDKDLYDTFGNVHKMNISFAKVPGVANQWQATVSVDGDAEVNTNTSVDIGTAGNTENTFLLNFDNLGSLSSVTDGQGDAITEGSLLIPVAFDVADTSPDGEGNQVRQDFNLNLGDVGSYTNSVTQFAETSSTKAFKQDGYGMGYLDTFKIDQSGIVTGVYSNGTNRELGQIALASFTNPGGLDKAGESTFVVSNNSGDPNIGPSGIAGKGKFIAGALEMSNVDLAEQFTDMIVTQRGFQSNSKTITTSDEMLQTLLQLKR